MRTASSAAIEGFGFNPREGLRRALVASFYARTALLDGRPAAMWGIAGSLLGDSAEVWLVLTEEAKGLPRLVLTEARAELARAMQRYGAFSATVLPDDEPSVRFARHLGFKGDDRIPLGDSYGIRMAYGVA